MQRRTSSRAVPEPPGGGRSAGWPRCRPGDGLPLSPGSGDNEVGGARDRRVGEPSLRGPDARRMTGVSMFLAAVVQMTSTSDAGANWDQARRLVERAAGYGARLVATPENTNFLGPPAEKVRTAEPLDGPTCRRFADLARRLGIHLLLGSFNERGDEPARCHNTSVLFGPDGATLAAYRKIHLFDVDVSEAVRCRESECVAAGRSRRRRRDRRWAGSGLSICYDLRFGNLYRRLVGDGAEILCVPAAFTMTTGRDHWEPLLRARAIECQCLRAGPGAVRPARRPGAARELRPRDDRRPLGARGRHGVRRPRARPGRDRPRPGGPRPQRHPGGRALPSRPSDRPGEDGGPSPAALLGVAPLTLRVVPTQ